MRHYPKGKRYTALEKNELKYRAFEMVLILFHVQQLRGFVVGSLRTTGRLTPGLSKSEPKAWQVLVDDGILTPEESAEIQQLIDYRNIIAHATERLTVNVNREWSTLELEGLDSYNRRALERLDVLINKIHSGMAARYVLPISFESLMFEPAERIYKEELRRLRTKIDKQLTRLKAEIDEVNANITSLPSGLIAKLQPSHPRNKTRRGTLSSHGVECCYALFRVGATPLAVAYLMRISLRAAKARFIRWKSKNGR